MTIQVNQVEGNTTRKGLKQNQVYKIISESSVENFYDAVNTKGKKFSIWNYKGDWSGIGISQDGKCRYTYTKNFTITQ